MRVKAVMVKVEVVMEVEVTVVEVKGVVDMEETKVVYSVVKKVVVKTVKVK